MENRHGLLVDFALTQARGTAERDMTPHLIDQAHQRGFHPRNLGADKGYDTVECMAALRQLGVTPHVAQNTSGRRSAIDERTTSWPGYAASQQLSKWVEEGRCPTSPCARARRCGPARSPEPAIHSEAGADDEGCNRAGKRFLRPEVAASQPETSVASLCTLLVRGRCVYDGFDAVAF